MAVSNAIIRTDVAQVSRVFAALVAPAFVKTPVMMNLMYSEDIPRGQNTATKGFRKEGSMTAAALAEATILAYDANGRRQDTAVDITAAKAIVVSGVSLENQTFNDQNLASYARSQGTAIGRFVDDSVIANYSSLTNAVDAGDTITVDHLDQAAQLILAANTPDPQTPLQFVGTPKAMRQLKADIRTSGGAMWSNTQFLSIFNGNPQPNGYYGSLPGMDLYTTSGHANNGGVLSLALFHPQWCFAGIFDRSVNTDIQFHGASGGLINEITSWFFYGSGIWNDLAGCEITLTA